MVLDVVKSLFLNRQIIVEAIGLAPLPAQGIAGCALGCGATFRLTTDTISLQLGQVPRVGVVFIWVLSRVDAARDAHAL